MHPRGCGGVPLIWAEEKSDGLFDALEGARRPLDLYKMKSWIKKEVNFVMEKLELEIPVFTATGDASQIEKGPQCNLIEIPEWLHQELKSRARLQWEAMQPVMGYNEFTKQYYPAEIREASATQAHVDIIKTVKALYEAPIFDPDGNQIDVTEEIFAWWDEYSMQCSMFPGKEELEEAQTLVANYFQNDKRFTIGRWFAVKSDQLQAKEDRELGQLN